MSLLREIALQDLTPARLWTALDADTRALAARALYGPWDEQGIHRAEADRAIAAAIRFRPQAVKKLPLEKRVQYLVRAVRPDDSLATSLLMALHLGERHEMLSVFLEHLGVPQEAGAIEDDHELVIDDPAKLREAIDVVRQRFPQDQVDLYLASLLAMDPDVWGLLAETVATDGD